MNDVSAPTSPTTEPGFLVWTRSPSGVEETYADGSASIEWGAPVTEATLFNVGSVAKQATAFLVLHAAHQGVLGLDSPAHRYLPTFRVTAVTVRELLQHHGGVRDAESMLSLAGLRELDHYTADDLIEIAGLQRERAVPPSTFLYSNTGYVLVAKILELRYGTDLQAIADELLFRPNGMDGARYRQRPTEVIRGAASSYKRGTDGNWERCDYPVTVPGPGSLWCSLNHLRTWLAFLAADWRDMQAPTALASLPAVASDRPRLRYGAGIYIDPSYTTVLHEGHEHGFSAAVCLGREGGQIIVLSNRSDLDAARLAATLRSRPPALPAEIARRIMNDPRSPTLDAARRDDAGHARGKNQDVTTYRCPEAIGTIGLSAEDNHIVLHRRGARLRLQASNDDPCRFDGAGVTIRTLHAPSEDNRPMEGFTLDLARAPGLQYVRFHDSQMRRRG